MTSRFKLLALALPLVLLVLMVGRSEWHLAHSESWLFRMAGYDPRDLLRGHYLQLRLVVEPTGSGEQCDAGDSSCCYCLSPGVPVEGVGFEAAVERISCDVAPEQCVAYVRGAALHALDRFYIPEKRRVELEERFRSASEVGRAHLLVAVDASGNPRIEQVFIDGQPISAPDDSEREPVTEAIVD